MRVNVLARWVTGASGTYFAIVLQLKGKGVHGGENGAKQKYNKNETGYANYLQPHHSALRRCIRINCGCMTAVVHACYAHAFDAAQNNTEAAGGQRPVHNKREDNEEQDGNLAEPLHGGGGGAGKLHCCLAFTRW